MVIVIKEKGGYHGITEIQPPEGIHKGISYDTE